MTRPSSLNSEPSWLRDVSPVTWIWIASVFAFLVYFYVAVA